MKVARLFFLLCLAFPPWGRAATFTVTNANDSGAGSLRQAILNANTTAGSNAINFNITSGGLTISLASALPAITNTMSLNGHTQTGYVNSPLIEINGLSAGNPVDGLKLMASNCTIRGLAINRFSSNGLNIVTNGFNRVLECYFGLAPDGVTIRSNILNGIYVTNSPYNQFAANIISGNLQNGVHIGGSLAISNWLNGNLIGLDRLFAKKANGQDGVRLNAPRNLIGDLQLISNFISGNNSNGVQIVNAGSSNNIVSWNLIGLNDFLFPSAVRPNALDGVVINGAPANLIANNLIGGNGGDGIKITGTNAFLNRVTGNSIGAPLSGTNTNFGNLGHGVQITSNAFTNSIGIVNTGSTNVIAYNGGDGVFVSSGTNNSIRGNSIYSNGGLGIDLGTDGITTNDVADADTGANQLQNFPLLSVATNSATGTVVYGTLNSRASVSFALDFYSNAACDPSANGEGQVYLGSTNVTTDGVGNLSFVAKLTPTNLTGRYITATATDPFGNTSEFSPCATAVSTLAGVTYTVVNTNDNGAGSLRQAILNANASFNSGDVIAFNIPGGGVKTIMPLTALPVIADTVLIDGYTQPGTTANTLTNGQNAALKIRLDGSLAPVDSPGLAIAASGCTVRGLVVVNFRGSAGHGITLQAGTGSAIEGCRIGLEADGVTSAGNGGAGVNVAANTSSSRVGGSTLAARSVISANGNCGILISNAPANKILGNLIGTDALGVSARGNTNGGVLASASPFNSIGGTNVLERNVISGNVAATPADRANGVTLLLCASNFVFGNYIGLNAAGTSAIGNNNNGVSIEGASGTNFIGGPLPGAGNMISGNDNWGVGVSGGSNNLGTIIQGNRIGTSANGLTAVGNVRGGVGAQAFNTIVGGSNPGEGNLISGNFADGIGFGCCTGSGNRVQGNRIGTDVTGFGALGNSDAGVAIEAPQNTVGGTNAGAGNTIAFNGDSGVLVLYVNGNPILGNSIHSNGGLGIDLFPGLDVTPNDPGDLDTGANDYQNFPVLTTALITPTDAAVLGTLNSEASSAYRLEFFVNDVCDGSGYGEGKTFLGATNVTTDVNGDAPFQMRFNGLSTGQFVTATATATNGSTSEFSPCAQLIPFNSADLAVSVIDSIDPASIAGGFSYFAQVVNNGPTNATGVVLTNFLPAGVTFSSATSTRGRCTFSAGVVRCSFGPVTNGETIYVTINVTGGTVGYATNRAFVHGNEIDHDPSDNAAEETTFLGIADLVLTRSVSTNTPVAGHPVTYTMVLSNAGPDTATNVLLREEFDPSVVVTSATASQGSASFGENFGALQIPGLAFGGVATLTVQAIPTMTSLHSDAGHVFSGDFDPDTGNNDTAGSIDAQPGAGVFEFTNATFTIRENGGAAVIGVHRNGGAAGTATVQYATSNLMATAGVDYASTSGTLTFTNGEILKSFSVPITNDGAAECNEEVALRLFNATGGAVVLGRSNATLTIFEDDVIFAGTLAAVSLDTNTPAATGGLGSQNPVVNSNGTFVAFASFAPSLVVNDTNGTSDVFLRNVTNSTTILISVNTNGSGSGNGASDSPRVSADGKRVAFSSYATDLAPGDNNLMSDIFLRDVAAGTTTLVSVNQTGNGSGNGASSNHRMTPNGRFVVFESEANNLVSNDANGFGTADVFLRDLSNNVVELISVNGAGTASGNGASSDPSISDDGRYVAFTSAASDLGPLDLNSVEDVYVRDRLAGTNFLCSFKTNGVGAGNGSSYQPTISANGRYVIFLSDATDLAAGDVNDATDIFAYDILNHTLQLVSANFAGTGPGNGYSFDPSVSSTGRLVAFYSESTDLVTNDSNGSVGDIFVRDLVTGNTALVSLNCHGTGSGNDYSYAPGISADGRFVAFESFAGNLAPGDFTLSVGNIFRRDLQSGVTMIASANLGHTGSGNNNSYLSRLSADGSSVAFQSSASDLTAIDLNEADDVFVWRAGATPGTNAYIASIKSTTGQRTLTVRGSPGALYEVQRTTNLTIPISWTPLGTTNAPAGGQFQFIDQTPPPGSAFYRVARP